MTGTFQYPQFLLLGDSIVEFSPFVNDSFSFGVSLARHCARRLDVINRGLSGYNTAHELVILEHLIPSPSCAKVEYLLLLFGANDASLPDGPTKQHVPSEKYRQNLKKILTHPSITAHNPTILLVTPPPINEAHLLAEDVKRGYTQLTRTQIVTAQYAEIVREVASELRTQGSNVVLVDLWSALMKEAKRLTPGYVDIGSGTLLGTMASGDSEGLHKLLVDGLHLTGAGYKVFLDEVLPHVGKGWAEEPVGKPNWIFPHWSVAPRIDG